MSSKIETVEKLLSTIVKRKMAFAYIYSAKDDICKDLVIEAVYRKEEKVDQISGIAIAFESLVGVGAFLIYIDYCRIGKLGESRLFS